MSFLAPRRLRQKTTENDKKTQKPIRRFTNQQILQLQTRFVLQQFISTSDRDDIAHSLGISGAQVATWFRNRRAKRRRDLKKFKSDVRAAKIMDNEKINRLCKRWEI